MTISIKHFITSLSAVLLLFTATAYSQSVENYKIIGYVMGSRMNPENPVKANQLTHINYAFANIKDGKIVEGNVNDAERLKELNSLRSENSKLKLLVSVGGWSWSGGFSDAVLSSLSREIFANSAIEFLLKHKLDGIDLDWEYPGQTGAGNTFREEDKQNFTLALKRIRQKMDSLTAITNEKYLLTIASAANQNYLDHVEMNEIHKFLDMINIMTYDFSGEWTTLTSHHTNLYPSATDPNPIKQSTQTAVELHLAAGAPPEKLVVGVAFYGRGWHGVEKKNNGLHQQAAGKGFSAPYKVISDSISAGTYKRYWDEKASAPYLWKPTSATFVTYDDIESLQRKCDFIKKFHLGGVMFWEYHADNGMLLKTLYDALLTEK